MLSIKTPAETIPKISNFTQIPKINPMFVLLQKPSKNTSRMDNGAYLYAKTKPRMIDNSLGNDFRPSTTTNSQFLPRNSYRTLELRDGFLRAFLGILLREKKCRIKKWKSEMV